MKRGMITLTKDDISYILSLLPQLNSAPPQLEIRFLAALAEISDPVTIGINEEIIEVILDSLPMPTSAQKPQLKNLRTKIEASLKSLRGVQGTPSAL